MEVQRPNGGTRARHAALDTPLPPVEPGRAGLRTAQIGSSYVNRRCSSDDPKGSVESSGAPSRAASGRPSARDFLGKPVPIFTPRFSVCPGLAFSVGGALRRRRSAAAAAAAGHLDTRPNHLSDRATIPPSRQSRRSNRLVFVIKNLVSRVQDIFTSNQLVPERGLRVLF